MFSFLLRGKNLFRLAAITEKDTVVTGTSLALSPGIPDQTTLLSFPERILNG